MSITCVNGIWQGGSDIGGERAPVHVAERIWVMVLAGDAEGLATWKAVAARMENLGAVPIGTSVPSVTVN